AAPAPKPMEDREPEVTAMVKRVIDAARRRALVPADFAYVPASLFPDQAQRDAEKLRSAGELRRTTLLDRKEVGDDRVYLYELEFTARTLRLRLGLAPDNRIALFSLVPK